MSVMSVGAGKRETGLESKWIKMAELDPDNTCNEEAERGFYA
jgi:hypothetical protein